MSFTLVPKYGEAREVNVWVWRPTLELIRNAKLIDEKSYEKMRRNDGDVQVDAVTAWKIADLIDQTIEKNETPRPAAWGSLHHRQAGKAGCFQDARGCGGGLLGESRVVEGLQRV
jgi:hypothetical protein